jgi:hypothetical protein
MRYQFFGDGDDGPVRELPDDGYQLRIRHIVTTPNGSELVYTRHILLTSVGGVLQVHFIPPGENARSDGEGRTFDWPHEPTQDPSSIRSRVRVTR